MELSYALTWMVATSAVFGLAASLRQLRARLRGWFYVNALVLLVTLAGAAIGWSDSGYLAVTVWLMLVVVPGWIEQRLESVLRRSDSSRAAFWARMAQLLHPFDGYRERSLIYESQAHFDAGRSAEAKGALYPLLTRTAWSERAKLELLGLDAQWDRISAHARSQKVGTRDLQLAPLYLRAFGELGDLESMWSMYGEMPPHYAQQPAFTLLMASYSGLVETTGLVLARCYADLLPHQAAQFRAIALAVSGDATRARQVLTELVQSDPSSAHRTWRMAHLPQEVRVDRLSAAIRQQVERFVVRVRTELSGSFPQEKARPMWATPTLALVLIFAYLMALPGGSTDPANLVRMGALVIPMTLTGDEVAWRLVAAGFLHLGATHLLMNCLGLWILGRQIERLWGGASMLLVFLGASVGSFTCAAYFVEASSDAPRIFLGASSGVLGLVGALAVHLTTGYFVHGRRTLGKRILVVGAVVGAQFVFDWFTPIVSSMLHVTGLLLGSVVSVPISFAAWRRHLADP